jgi:hypothetical protein
MCTPGAVTSGWNMYQIDVSVGELKDTYIYIYIYIYIERERERERERDEGKWCLAFKMSGAMGFGPREEKEATTGATEFFIIWLFNMFPRGFLKNRNLEHEEQNHIE